MAKRDKSPTTFAEMLDTSRGNLLQRAAKAWIKPRDPGGTIQLMEQLQVHTYQTFVIEMVQRAITLSGGKKSKESNYVLGPPNLNSMIKFATHWNSLNEVIHIAALGLIAWTLLDAIATGKHDVSVFANLAAFIINAYSELAQRYSRARLSLVIDKALLGGKDFHPEKYDNIFDLKLPQK